MAFRGSLTLIGGCPKKEGKTVVELVETTAYSVNGHFDRLNDLIL